jgi:hypothetical protein
MSLTALSSNSIPAQLTKLASGEFTAASVIADPKDAIRLALVREKDGNYVTAPVAPDAGSSHSSPRVLFTLPSLKMGGN